MTSVLPSSATPDYYLSFTMPCGFNGDSVDFDSVVVDSEFCAGDWALPSPVCTSNTATSTTNSNNNNNRNNITLTADNVGRANLPNEDMASGNFNFSGQSNVEPRNNSERNNNMEIDDAESSLVADELKHRMLAKYEDECAAKMRTDEFDNDKREKTELKSNENGGCGEAEDEDELFFQPPRRISMLWNSKLRWKEERKKVLKISINKLRRIEDPELFLCRSVLINNTVRRLHREIREEKMARYPDIHRPVPVTSCSLASCNNGSIPESFPRKRAAAASFDHRGGCGNPLNQTVSCYSKDHYKKDGRSDGDNSELLTIDQESEAIPPVAKRMRTSSVTSQSSTTPGGAGSGNNRSSADGGSHRNGGRTDQDFGGVSSPVAVNGESQFPVFSAGELLTPDANSPNSRQAPPLVTSLLSSSNASSSDSVQPSPQPCLQPLSLVSHQGNGCSLNLTTCSSITATLTSGDRIKAKCDPSRSVTAEGQKDDKLSSSSLSMTPDAGHANGASQASKERRNIVSEYEKQYSQYSCGQLSIFGELQSVVFHSLIASLES